MFKNIQNTKPIKSDNKSETEVHSLVCHRDLYVYLYSIKSFIKNTTNNCSIIVHDDGSLTEDDIRMLKKHIEGLKIYNVKEADKIVIPKLEKYPLIKKLRSENVLLRKLTDFYFLSKTGKIISLDSDILFLRKAKEIKNWIDMDKKEALLSSEYPVNSHQDKYLINTELNYVKNLNSGLICYYKSMINLELAEKCFKMENFVTLYRPNGVGDQKFMAVNFGEARERKNIKINRLNPNLYIHNRNIENKYAIAKHYWSSKYSLRKIYAYYKDVNRVYNHIK